MLCHSIKQNILSFFRSSNIFFSNTQQERGHCSMIIFIIIVDQLFLFFFQWNTMISNHLFIKTHNALFPNSYSPTLLFRFVNKWAVMYILESLAFVLLLLYIDSFFLADFSALLIFSHYIIFLTFLISNKLFAVKIVGEIQLWHLVIWSTRYFRNLTFLMLEWCNMGLTTV